jgi:hypothetical protein
MSDIFSLNGCYLESDIVNACGQDKLASAKTLLEADITSELSTNAATLITGEPNSLTVENEHIVSAALSSLELNKKNTKRSLQINTYYAKKRTAQNYIMKVIYIMVLLVVIMWALQMYTTLIPEWILSTGMALTIGVCSIIIIFKSADISNRSTFDYDQKISTLNNLPPLDEQGALYSSADQQMKSSSVYGKSCQNNECCPKFFSFNPSLGYCSFNPIQSV